MNKQQKNKKLIKQNKRNNLINRYYSSNIKNLSKRIKLLFSSLTNETIESEKESLYINIIGLMKVLYSMLDKAAKKKVIHKNCAARKKSKLAKLINKSFGK
jgi:small subunit ribosomal protein S20